MYVHSASRLVGACYVSGYEATRLLPHPSIPMRLPPVQSRSTACLRTKERLQGTPWCTALRATSMTLIRGVDFDKNG